MVSDLRIASTGGSFKQNEGFLRRLSCLRHHILAFRGALLLQLLLELLHLKQPVAKIDRRLPTISHGGHAPAINDIHGALRAISNGGVLQLRG